MKKYKLLIIALFSLLLLTGCNNANNEEGNFTHEDVNENPVAVFEFEKYGNVTMEFYPNEAYNTVANFITLIEDGFYDNNVITRVQKGFVVQAGGLKDPGYTIKGEFAANGIENNIKHEEGIVSMARSNDMNSASGQFFIMLDSSPSLDGLYAAFGKVTEGMDIIHKIENSKLSFNESVGMGFLNTDSYIKIKKATVDTKGYTYKVEKIK